ncbi:OmpP1/FadL family transporter [Bacteroides togonis]|uniref:OmpP1/FadL family transporter n=1 Tax=Bacteroides togonis TaxID=1917883 RepID=UPI00094B6724|nr:outer membrane protein transport protein [Bacteroides togonis]
MKKIIIGVSVLLLTLMQTHAQTVYDAVDFATKDLDGTARFVGMGGAMGALGGDISTMGTNPAGIGIYRSNDASLSFSYSALSTEAKYLGNTYNASKNRWNFDNIGVVFSTKIGNQTTLRYVNFGFNYHKANTFNRNMWMAGDLQGHSQLFQIAGMTDGLTPEHWNSGAIFDNNDIGWLSALGWEGYLVSPSTSSLPDDIADQIANSQGKLNPENFGYYPILGENNQPYYIDNVSGELTFNSVTNGQPNEKAYENYGFYTTVAGDAPYLREYRSHESGGLDQYDFNVAFNLNDRVYLGLTVGAYDLDYNKYTLYNEDSQGRDGAGYKLESYNNISGGGVDFKLGAIIRPFQYSPLRIGLAIHTPIFYKLTHTTSAVLTSDFAEEVIDTRNYLKGGDMNFEYQLKTPWTYNVSLGYTVGSSLALGAEYEYKDYSNIKFQYSDGMDMSFETHQAENFLRGVHTLRLGAEYKFIPQFSLRAGYNLMTSPYQDGSIKALSINSINTDTDFMNLKARNIYTLGIGYRGSIFYADLAYKLTSQKADFYPFAYCEMDDNDNVIYKELLSEPAKVKFSRSQVLLTLGMRF